MKKIAVGILLALAVAIICFVLLPWLANLLIEWSAVMSDQVDGAVDLIINQVKDIL